MRCCSAFVAPGRMPLSRSPWRTHLRSVSAVQQPAIDSIAAHCDGYWSLASKTMRTARSITSGENFGDFLMLAPFSQSKEPPQIRCGSLVAIKDCQVVIDDAQRVPQGIGLGIGEARRRDALVQLRQGDDSH